MTNNIENQVILPSEFHSLPLENQIEWFKRLSSGISSAGEENKNCGVRISRNQSIVLGETFAKLINAYAPEIAVVVDVSKGTVYSKGEFENVADLSRDLTKANSILFFDDMGKLYSFDKTCELNMKLADAVEVIKSTRRNGKPLSKLEKYQKAYDLIANHGYSAPTEKPYSMENFETATRSFDSFSVGNAEILTQLLTKLGISAESSVAGDAMGEGERRTFAVKIKDKKYGIDGVFYSDPTFGEKQGEKFITDFVSRLQNSYDKGSVSFDKNGKYDLKGEFYTEPATPENN